MKEPKIGLALGVRRSERVCSYWCNKGFKEAGIPIHMIAGSSMGALIGTFYRK